MKVDFTGDEESQVHISMDNTHIQIETLYGRTTIAWPDFDRIKLEASRFNDALEAINV